MATGTVRGRKTPEVVPCHHSVLGTVEETEAASFWSSKNKYHSVSAGSNMIAQWVCPQGHEWRMEVRTVVKHPSCPQCRTIQAYSKQEKDLANWVESLGFTIERNDRNVLCGQELDILIPSRHVAIEYNGMYWHSVEKRGPHYHLNKYEEAKLAGVHLIYIWEDQWVKNPDKVKADLKDALGYGGGKIPTSELIIQEGAAPTEFLSNNRLTLAPKANRSLLIRDNTVHGVLRLKDDTIVEALYDNQIHWGSMLQLCRKPVVLPVDSPHHPVLKDLGYVPTQIIPTTPYYYDKGKRSWGCSGIQMENLPLQRWEPLRSGSR